MDVTLFPKATYPISGYVRYKSVLGELIPTEVRDKSEVECRETLLLNPEFESIFLADKWGSNYWHWHFDVFPPVLFLNRYFGTVSDRKFVVSERVVNTQFFKWWFEKMGAVKFEIGKEESRCGLCVVDFDWRHAGSPNPFVLEMIRSLTVPEFPASDLNILIQRGCQSQDPFESRNIENRDEICELFSRNRIPLTILYLEGMSVPEQISIFSRASVVIGVHGAGLTNLMFCKPGTVAIEIESPLASHCMYLRICSLVGIKSASLLGEVTNLRHNFFHQSLRVDPVALLNIANDLISKNSA